MNIKSFKTEELLKELSTRINYNLEDNQIVCPTCSGLHFYIKKRGDNYYYQNCKDCHNGINYKCKFCGKNNPTNRCDCNESDIYRNKLHEEECLKTKKERFKNADKIDFYEYKGRFLIGDYAEEPDALEDWLVDIINSDEDLPEYVWATKAVKPCGFDLIGEMSERIADEVNGEVLDYVDMNDELIDKAKKAIIEWEKKNENCLTWYYEDYTVAVMLDKVIENIRKEIDNE